MNNLTIDLDTLTDEQKKQIAEWANKPKEWPQIDGKYYFANVDETIGSSWWSGDRYDTDLMAIGNCFRTAAEAIAYREHLKVCAELRKLADGGCCYLAYRDPSILAYTSIVTGRRSSPYTFSTTASAENAIDTIGADRLRDHYFMYGVKK